jgi:hypothetical protein
MVGVDPPVAERALATRRMVKPAFFSQSSFGGT